MDVIKIKPDKFPYTTKARLGGGQFKLGFKYNKLSDRIYVDLYDSLDNLIHENELMQFGIPLWLPIMQDVQGNLNTSFPDKWLIPLSPTGKEYPVNLGNIQTNIFLALVDRSEELGTLDLILYD